MAEPTNLTNQNTTTTTTTTTTWGTLEELLLACAVNRHGTTSWDSIARELQKRMSSSHFTPHICQQKYRDLKRRFAADVSDRNAGETAGEIAADDGDNTGLCLDELRKLRVAELRRELDRYDISIVSLQLKVKRLKEEREIPDLVNNQEREGTKNESPETIAGGESDLRNESVNESVDEPVTESIKPESEPDRISEPDSFNGSSNSKDPEPVKESSYQEGGRVDSAELGESVAESKGEEGVKDTSDVQSTASLSRREKTVVVTVVSGNSSGEENQSAAVKSTNGGKSQPLINFLKVVRASKLGSVFGRRLESQETPKYRNLIRQHMDLGMIQRRLEEGLYSDCHTKFYRDLMLLVTNAIVFFNNKSSEHKAALDLRQLVTKQSKSHLNPLKSQPPKPNNPPAPPPKPPKIEPNPADHTPNVKPKLAINGPVIACRKRSSIAGKPSMTGERNEPLTPAGEKTSSSFNAMTKKRTRDQSFGSRSSSSKNNSSSNKTRRPSPSPSPIPKLSPGPTQSLKPSPSTPLSAKGENSEAKADKKKPSPANSSSKAKRGSGSGNGSLLDLLKNNGGNKGDRRKDQGGSRSGLASREEKKKEKGKEKVERESVASRNTGRPPKRAAAATSATGKRGREHGGETESLPKKRQRK